MLGAVAIVTALVYLVTPVTASGPEGEPIGFEPNLRYLAPGLALALCLLPVSLTSFGVRLQIAGAVGLAAVAIAVVRGAGPLAGGPPRRRDRARRDRRDRTRWSCARRPARRGREGAGAGARRSPWGSRCWRSSRLASATSTTPLPRRPLRRSGRRSAQPRPRFRFPLGARAERRADRDDDDPPVPALWHRPLEPRPVRRRRGPERRLHPRRRAARLGARPSTRAPTTTSSPRSTGLRRTVRSGRLSERGPIARPNARPILRDGPAAVFELTGPLDPEACRSDLSRDR